LEEPLKVCRLSVSFVIYTVLSLHT
jgi:hypothetical protein